VIAALAAGTLAAPTVAQQPPVEEIVVVASPIRDSQLAAIEAKRNAFNMVDIVAADTIGRFPDQNLADSLGRLPGLAIERDQGQARYINLRGAPFRYTSIAFDGINVPGAESGRVPRFDSFPSVITSRVEANKAILPSMPGESIAGYININTYNPFEQDGFAFSGDVGMGEQKLGGGDVERGSLRASWSGENFGIVVFASENSREQVTDNREYDLSIGTGGALQVNELDFRSYIVTREDAAHGATLEGRFDGALERVFFSTLYSEFVDKEERNQFVFGLPGLSGNTGYVPGTAVTRLLEYGQYDNSTDTSTLGADFRAGEWLMEARVNYTETEFNIELPITRDIGLAAIGYDVSDIENPIVNIYALGTQNPIAPGQVSYSRANLGIFYDGPLGAEATKIKLDADRDITLMGMPAVLELGMQLDQRDAEGYLTLGIGASPVLGGVDVEAFNTGRLWDAKSVNSIGGTYYDNIGLRAAWERSPVWMKPTPADSERIVIEEDITALYAMTTVETDWGNVVAGARLEQTDYTSSGRNAGTPVTVTEDFTHVLPSAHVNVDLRDDLKWRISGSTGISRPSYNEWRAAASVNVTNKTVSGGNPTLKPEETAGVDSAIEWYFAPANILSAGVFYRFVNNVIYTDSRAIDGGFYLPSAKGEVWTYNGTVNGGDGWLRGIEANLIADAPESFGFLQGFGVSANLTLLESEFEGLNGRKYQLPGTSDLIYNASLYYENFGLSARVNYQYRDEWISPIESPDEVWGEQQRVDLSISYQLPMDIAGAQLSVYLNANNLTDEVDLRYAGNRTVNQRESYGRHYLAGLRINF
jgi:TonB-dependent receptor